MLRASFHWDKYALSINDLLSTNRLTSRGILEEACTAKFENTTKVLAPKRLLKYCRLMRCNAGAVTRSDLEGRVDRLRVAQHLDEVVDMGGEVFLQVSHRVEGGHLGIC